MKFRIKHATPAFYYGVIIPWFVIIAAIFLFILLGFTIKDKYPTIVFGSIIALCVAVDVIFILLISMESIFGAKIIVEADHVKINMLLRRKKLYYNNIADMKYTHYECTRNKRYRKERSDSLLYKMLKSDENVRIRSLLIFYPILGKDFSLNDDAPNYEWKQKKWITDPNLDPDEDVKLYQAYLCCRSAYRQYNNSADQD